MPQTDYQQRKEQGLCTRCGDPAADGAGLCEPHLDDQRKRVARSLAVSRDRRREAGLCIMCPETRPTPVPAGERTCSACRIRRRRKPLSAERVNNDVNKRARIAAATRTHGDGRTRYHASGKRGSQPTEKLDAEDLLWARNAITIGEDALKMLLTPAVQQLPRIQREDVKHAALHQLIRAQGHLGDVIKRRGGQSADRLRDLQAEVDRLEERLAALGDTGRAGHTKQRHGRRDGE